MKRFVASLLVILVGALGYAVYDLREQNQRVQSALATQNRQLAALKGGVERHNREVANQQTEEQRKLHALQAELAAARNVLQKLRSDLEDAKEQKAVDARMPRPSEDLTEESTKLKQLRQQIADVQKRIDETNRRIKDEASARHTTKREAEEYYSAQVQVRQEEINRLNTELHEIRDERTPKAKDRQRDLRALISQNQEFVRQIRTAKNAASASASAENNQRQQELARSRRSLPELTEQRDALKRSYDQELQNYQALQKDKGAYNAKQSSDQTEVASTQDKITLQQSIVARLEADVVTQEAEVHRLTIQPAP